MCETGNLASPAYLYSASTDWALGKSASARKAAQRRVSSMDHGGDRRSGASATARPWRGGGVAAGGGGPPPKVYRVEPKDFRELVQRLTGARTPAAPGPGPAHQRATLAPAMVTADSRHAQAAAAVPVPVPTEQLDYASWFSAPLLSPAAYGAPGFGGGHQQHHQGSSEPLL